MSHDYHTAKDIGVEASNGNQGKAKIITVHNSNHESVDRTFMGLPESYTANESQIKHSSNGRQWKDKRAQNSTTNVTQSPVQLLYV